MAESAECEEDVEDETAGLCEDPNDRKVLDARSRKLESTNRTSFRSTACLAAQCLLLVVAVGGAFLLGRATSTVGLVKMASEPRWQAAALGEAGKAQAVALASTTMSTLPAAALGEAGKAQAVALASTTTSNIPAAALGEASKETASTSSTESALPAVAPGQAGKAVASASRAQPTPPAVAPSKANETVAPAGPPERGNTATSAAPKAPPRLRLVINSFVAYGKPLGLLLESLQKAKFHHHFRDVVVSVSGSTADVGPHDVPGRWGELGVTIINTTLMSFDFAGLSTIFHHLDHPRVRAHAYLYVHDTVFADATFTSSFEKLASIIREDEVRAPGSPNSNMFAFGHKVVRNYTTNFDHNLTKWDGVLAEFGYTVKGMKNIKKFATKVTNLPQRVPRGTGDPYHTGVLRKKYWYPDFALYKFILDGKYGDITSGRAGLKPNR